MEKPVVDGGQITPEELAGLLDGLHGHSHQCPKCEESYGHFSSEPDCQVEAELCPDCIVADEELWEEFCRATNELFAAVKELVEWAKENEPTDSQDAEGRRRLLMLGDLLQLMQIL